MRIRDGKNLDPGWKKFGSGINIPDPQQWMKCNVSPWQSDRRARLGSSSSGVAPRKSCSWGGSSGSCYSLPPGSPLRYGTSISGCEADPGPWFGFMFWMQCSGSGIQCLFDLWIRDPGSRMEKIRIWDVPPGSTTLFLLLEVAVKFSSSARKHT